jgi:hypothetical protein
MEHFLQILELVADMVDIRGVGTGIVGLTTTACSKMQQQLLRIAQDAKET